ncbi:hypothetical protein KIPE111705_01925 [Kibdelosporangium persicum]|uniref:Arginine/ornithine antiporter ArcD n=1 Tax=Kibdelosporangium persicum TaxID=2698649 RepID=A0ABX2FJ91_9PSEU|nr:hypothetical protein [Kibdelosporangium persicum]NRN71189.1 Arginine/ornithine antiporter ArcD [Kibdelosporangium persicum]
MKRKVKVRHWPGRLATGAFILSSGLNKRHADEQTAQTLHGFAGGAYPMLRQLDPKSFVRMVSWGEIALGAALLLPVVPTAVAGLGLTAFSAGLLGLYLRTPGMREEGSLRPTEQGTGLAKDVWMLGMGVGFVVDGLTSKNDDQRERGRARPTAGRTGRARRG